MSHETQASKPRPPFSALPLRKGDPPYSAWGLYGPDDELGTLNLLTPERVLSAVKDVSTGESVGLNLPLNVPNPPSHNRVGFSHKIKHSAPRNVHDDLIDMNTQVRRAQPMLQYNTCYKTNQHSARHNGTASDTTATRLKSSATMG